MGEMMPIGQAIQGQLGQMFDFERFQRQKRMMERNKNLEDLHRFTIFLDGDPDAARKIRLEICRLMGKEGI